MIKLMFVYLREERARLEISVAAERLVRSVDRLKINSRVHWFSSNDQEKAFPGAATHRSLTIDVAPLSVCIFDPLFDFFQRRRKMTREAKETSVTTLDGITTRRRFFQGVGISALALTAFGTRQAFARQSQDEPVEALDLFEDEIPPAACNQLMVSTDRQASLIKTPKILFCDPCPCQGQDNWVSAINLQTGFKFASDCDELNNTQINITRLVWNIRNRFVRVNGPCGPIGSFDGKWKAFDPAGVLLFTGQLAGTLGYDPCLPVGTARCCEYPKILGILAGRGRPNTAAANCLARWTFCGEEGPDVCQPDRWDVGITGIVRCPC